MATDVGLRAVLEPEVDEQSVRDSKETIREGFEDRDFSFIPDIDTDALKQQIREGVGRAVGRNLGNLLPTRVGTYIGGVVGERIAGTGTDTSTAGDGTTDVGDEPPGEGTEGGAIGGGANEPDDLLLVAQEQLEVQQEILNEIEDLAGPRGDDSGGLLNKLKGFGGLGLMMGGALGALLGGGIMLGKELMDFLEEFEWPEINPPEIPEPDWVPIEIPEPEFLPFTVVEPEWLPIPITVPDIDPLTVLRPDWVPLHIVKPDWLPFEDPTEEPSPTEPAPGPKPTPGGSYWIPDEAPTEQPAPAPAPAPAPTPTVPPSELPNPGIVTPDKPTRGPLTTEKWLAATLGIGAIGAGAGLAAGAGGMGAVGGGTIPGLSSGGSAVGMAGTAGMGLIPWLKKNPEMFDILPEGEWTGPTGLNADMRAGSSSANTGPSAPNQGGQGQTGGGGQVRVKSVYGKGGQLMVVIQKGEGRPLTMPYSTLPPAWQEYVQQWLSRNSQGGGGGGQGGANANANTGGNGGNRAEEKRRDRETDVDLTVEQVIQLDPSKIRELQNMVDRKIDEALREFETRIDSSGANLNVSGGRAR